MMYIYIYFFFNIATKTFFFVSTIICEITTPPYIPRAIHLEVTFASCISTEKFIKWHSLALQLLRNVNVTVGKLPDDRYLNQMALPRSSNTSTI